MNKELKVKMNVELQDMIGRLLPSIFESINPGVRNLVLGDKWRIWQVHVSDVETQLRLGDRSSSVVPELLLLDKSSLMDIHDKALLISELYKLIYILEK